MYINRDIEKLLTITANLFQAIVIYGPRQIGKSTTVDYVFGNNYNYVTLDDSDDLFEALNNPKGFIQTHPWPLIIDEVQKARELLGNWITKHRLCGGSESEPDPTPTEQVAAVSGTIGLQITAGWTD